MTTDFGDCSYDEPYALVLQPDGKMILGGYTNSAGGPGVLFGRTAGPGPLQPQRAPRPGLRPGRQGGLRRREASTSGSWPWPWPGTGACWPAGYVDGEKRSDLLLARLRPDGSPAPGFGTTARGISVHNLGTHSERVSSVVLAPDGKIVAGGQTAVANNADFAVFRYDADGLSTTPSGGPVWPPSTSGAGRTRSGPWPSNRTGRSSRSARAKQTSGWCDSTLSSPVLAATARLLNG